jgi:hypothetical protein
MSIQFICAYPRVRCVWPCFIVYVFQCACFSMCVDASKCAFVCVCPCFSVARACVCDHVPVCVEQVHASLC